MANKILKQKALEMRAKQMSYSQIKEKLGLSKSTLSGWLKDYPLSKERINELRANNFQRIERFRNTMAEKQKVKKDIAYKKVSKDIGKINNREVFLAGLFLYWAEGGKTRGSTIVLTNTNPIMLQFYIKWLNLLGVSKDKLKINLHLYSDMNISEKINFWSKTLGISKTQFRKPYIKKNLSTAITYKNGFGQGTCCVVYDNKSMCDYVLMGLKRIQEL
ncbi:MAG: helix-turn-helix domain-containing protein [Candidatus Paceibacterota bacterium]